jgi:hypothetical protein
MDPLARVDQKSVTICTRAVGVLRQEVEEIEDLVSKATTSLKAERHKNIALGVNEVFPFFVLLGNTSQSSRSGLRSGLRANTFLSRVTSPDVKDVLLVATGTGVSTKKDIGTHSGGTVN